LIEEFRVRGFSHHYFTGNENRIGVYRGVPAEKIGTVVRALFRNGAKSVRVEDEASWVEAERECEEEDRA